MKHVLAVLCVLFLATSYSFCQEVKIPSIDETEEGAVLKVSMPLLDLQQKVGHFF